MIIFQSSSNLILSIGIWIYCSIIKYHMIYIFCLYNVIYDDILDTKYTYFIHIHISINSVRIDRLTIEPLDRV
jgi:hypothetical protein